MARTSHSVTIAQEVHILNIQTCTANQKAKVVSWSATVFPLQQSTKNNHLKNRDWDKSYTSSFMLWLTQKALACCICCPLRKVVVVHRSRFNPYWITKLLLHCSLCVETFEHAGVQSVMEQHVFCLWQQMKLSLQWHHYWLGCGQRSNPLEIFRPWRAAAVALQIQFEVWGSQTGGGVGGVFMCLNNSGRKSTPQILALTSPVCVCMFVCVWKVTGNLWSSGATAKIHTWLHTSLSLQSTPTHECKSHALTRSLPVSSAVLSIQGCLTTPQSVTDKGG